jgi:hypothetical protein
VFFICIFKKQTRFEPAEYQGNTGSGESILRFFIYKDWAKDWASVKLQIKRPEVSQGVAFTLLGFLPVHVVLI